VLHGHVGTLLVLLLLERKNETILGLHLGHLNFYLLLHLLHHLGQLNQLELQLAHFPLLLMEQGKRPRRSPDSVLANLLHLDVPSRTLRNIRLHELRLVECLQVSALLLTGALRILLVVLVLRRVVVTLVQAVARAVVRVAQDLAGRRRTSRGNFGRLRSEADVPTFWFSVNLGSLFVWELVLQRAQVVRP